MKTAVHLQAQLLDFVRSKGGGDARLVQVTSLSESVRILIAVWRLFVDQSKWLRAEGSNGKQINRIN